MYNIVYWRKDYIWHCFPLISYLPEQTSLNCKSNINVPQKGKNAQSKFRWNRWVEFLLWQLFDSTLFLTLHLSSVRLLWNVQVLLLRKAGSNISARQNWHCLPNIPYLTRKHREPPYTWSERNVLCRNNRNVQSWLKMIAKHNPLSYQGTKIGLE